MTPKMPRAFWSVHADAKGPLTRWRKRAVAARWKTFADVRADFGNADQYERFVIFNIGGNKDRLIAAIHYTTGCVYIRHVLTDAEYDRGNWKE